MLEIKVDPLKAIQGLRDIRTDQIPFAASKALNAVVLAGQKDERAHLRDIFDERRPDWLDRSVKITHFAKKKDLYATIGIHPPGADGEARKDILTKFESDTEKTPLSGNTIAIPTGVKRTKKDIVQKAFRPKALNFRREGGRIVGDKRTFIVQLEQGRKLILQRVGKGARSSTRSLYLLLPRVDIDPELLFEQTIGKAVDREWRQQFIEAFDLAVRDAR